MPFRKGNRKQSRREQGMPLFLDDEEARKKHRGFGYRDWFQLCVEAHLPVASLCLAMNIASRTTIHEWIQQTFDELDLPNPYKKEQHAKSHNQTARPAFIQQPD